MAAFQPLEERAVSIAAADGPWPQDDRATSQQLLDCEGGDEDAQEQRPKRWRQVRRALLALSLAAALAAALAWCGRDRLAVRQEALRGTVVLAEFSCEEGYENFLQGWSVGKRNWCCTFKQMGCPGEVPRGLVDEPFDCTAGASNWETGWSAQKKIYCCSHKEVGCPLVNDVYVTFVLANVNYDALMATEFLKGEVWNAIKQGISAYVANDIIPANIDLWYWRGSGLHSTTSDAANTGTVVRARIHVPKISKLQSVRDEVLHTDFPLRVSTSVTRVPGISTVSFDRVFVADVEVEQSIVAVCTCVNGVPETSKPRCPRIGGEVCEKCHTGFHLTSGFFCLPNTCTCTDGIAAQGELCKLHGTVKCASCSLGFHLENDQCLPNLCNCTNGFGATGIACGMHQGLICGSCYPGFSVDPLTRECKQSKCMCESGIAATGEKCTDDGAEICASCDPGFHVSADEATCERNICKCRRGVAALGPLCTYHQAEICAFCEPNFYLQKDGTCGPKVCLCPNGTAVQGNLCGTHHAILCSRCDKGYSLLLGQCINTPCECRNGLPLTMDACTKPGLSICGSCHRGYHLTDERECLPNVCTCQNGQPGVGKQCPVHEGDACSSCNPGYRTTLEQIKDQTGFADTISMSCVENTCTCLDGTTEVGEKATGKSKPPCYTNGGNVCVACKPGYHIGKGNQCFRNSCKCPKGTAVDDSVCTIDNARNCTACDPGYFLASQTPGDLQNGTEVPDPAVFAGKARVCLNAKMTTSAPFNCEVGMDNWEQAWSDVKKQYCCDRKNVGCIPKSTGKELCEGQGFNQQQCNLVGCCRYDATSKKCLSAVGNRVCFYEFNIKTAEGYCVQAIDADPNSATAKTKLLKLHNCNQAEKRQEWRPKATGQILNPVGECIQVSDFKAGAVVIVSTCDDDDDIDQKQIIKFDLSTQLLKVGKGDSTLCLTAHYQSNLNDLLIKLATCSTSDPNQRFSVALEGGGTRLL